VIARAAPIFVVSVLAWGAFTFGAVYPWGYWPLCVAAVSVGFMGIVVARRLPPGTLPLYLATALLAVCLAVAAQIAPLPPEVVTRLSPEAHNVQAAYAVGAGAAEFTHLSVSPRLTARALGILAALGISIVGGAAIFTAAGTTRVSAAITILGVLLSITALVQKASGTTKALGFWVPQGTGLPYGPFINHNHFAGWMLMAIPLSLGLLCAIASRQVRLAHLAIRERILWLGSPDASHVILIAGAVMVMLLAVFLSQCRSGTAIGSGSVAVMGALVWRGQSRGSRVGVTAVTAVMLIAVALWAGIDQLFTRFSDVAAQDYIGRVGAWRDAWHLAQRFPIAGTGVGTYAIAMLFYQQFNVEVYYFAAHNDFLQLLAEGGLLVGVPAAIGIIVLTLTIHRRFREEASRSTYWIRAGATVGLLAIGAQEMVEYSLQMPGNAFFFAVLSAIAVHRTPTRRRG
jgi:O-antigen ligase